MNRRVVKADVPCCLQCSTPWNGEGCATVKSDSVTVLAWRCRCGILLAFDNASDVISISASGDSALFDDGFRRLQKPTDCESCHYTHYPRDEGMLLKDGKRFCNLSCWNEWNDDQSDPV